jgi:putative transposase
MARIPRRLTVLPNFSVHKVWRGHNKENNLETDEEKLKYLELLNEELESEEYEKGAGLQALTLMTNHAHEMFQILVQTLFSDLMRRHHGRYGQYFNKSRNRCGKVAQDRPHTTLIGDENHEMQAVFYIHANPIRANIVKDARDYKWSTHKLYAFGIREDWMRNIELPQWYLKLGKNSSLRQREYRKLFALYLKIHGARKRFFLERSFFGEMTWVIEREEIISEWRSEHSPP